MTIEGNAPARDDDVVVCPGGPVLVRSTMVIDDDGKVLGKGRSIIALCACGKSGLAPLCDGSHKISNRRTPSSGRSTGPNVN